ncbi:hypothetical protein VTK73DRAFT_10298 [Phialemonium thermophilum]|uniref:Secreted protein n=1 Tax=Phialemonium thermophilum TaxID=223376 RepID=A0ABR3VXI7_9PEZI
MGSLISPSCNVEPCWLLLLTVLVTSIDTLAVLLQLCQVATVNVKYLIRDKSSAYSRHSCVIARDEEDYCTFSSLVTHLTSSA